MRIGIALVLASLLSYQAVRTALVRDAPKGSAALLWSSHPEVQLTRTMVEIGKSAARGQSLKPMTIDRVDSIARKSPLAAEPFLIKAAVAQLQRRDQLAEILLLEARRRDPRSAATRYLLAERYLRTRRVPQALTELSVLSRLLGQTSGKFAPALALFAREPGAVPQLKRFFVISPEFEPLVLHELAGDPKNANLVLALWSGRNSESLGASPNWKTRLVMQLVEQGKFAESYAVWRRLSGIETPSGGLFDPQFLGHPAPAPFNWAFSSSGGVVEPNGDSGLQVIYFGRSDAVLAEQLLLLAPGAYRLSTVVAGGSAEQSSVAWTLQCIPARRTIAELPIGPEQAMRALQIGFRVPSNGCAAQLLQLAGTAGEFSRSSEFTVAKLQLSKTLHQ